MPIADSPFEQWLQLQRDPFAFGTPFRAVSGSFGDVQQLVQLQLDFVNDIVDDTTHALHALQDVRDAPSAVILFGDLFQSTATKAWTTACASYEIWASAWTYQARSVARQKPASAPVRGRPAKAAEEPVRERRA